MPKVTGLTSSVHVEPAPPEGECCGKCGADASAFVKHPRLIGGNCGECGGIWLPALSFGPMREVEFDLDIRIV